MTMKLKRKTADRVTLIDTLISNGGDLLNVTKITRMDDFTLAFHLEDQDGLSCIWRRDLNETVRVLDQN